ncbi:MAG TPA: decaprenyl-phosphate phosphoribosyltransferase [Burkholderiales bacterium]|nr:decaprenyl-phosphate phosphoribosyltransferase [Burkholderiales bacterium]
MTMIEILKSLRPQQWIKNLFIFAPLVFSQNLFVGPLLIKTCLAFVAFCLVSSAHYIFNDLRDIEEDRRHPVKSQRPLASGRLKKGPAVAALLVIGAAGLGLAASINLPFLLMALGYLVLQTAYSMWLKHVVILDVFVIAAGFLIRVVAGGLAIRVEISSWLLVCTILLSLFLAMGKRRYELVLLDKDAVSHRPILREYNTYLLDQMISVVTASTLLAYCLYTISAETVAKFGTRNLIFTVPFVLYGIFRYLYLIHQKAGGGTPEALIIRDKPLLLDIFLWVLAAALILHFK